jgi:hypothetical protein
VSETVPSQTKVYKGKKFARFAKKSRIADAELWKAVQQANDGLIDGDLGGAVIKQRIARAGEGKSGGSRSIILFRRNNRAVFIHGYQKKDVANISSKELEAFRELAGTILGYSDAEINRVVEEGALVTVEDPKENDDA